MKATAQTAPAITAVEYSAFQQAYDFYNRELFDGTLPHVLVTLPHQKRSRGYFSANRFRGRTGAAKVHELALNPDEFQRTETEILSTLVHEMAHVWQTEHGHPGRGRYHNREWAAKMLDLGLHPSSTGEPGGAMTGQRVTHYIIKGGLFAKATARLIKTGFKLNWHSTPPPRNERILKAASKTKYSCPSCGLNAWAKPDVTLHCGECYDGGAGELVTLEAEAYALVGVR